jgi:hypothetical protein
MHMIAPVNAGTDSVREGGEQHPEDAGQRGGQGGDDHERVGPGLEVHHDQQVDQHDRAEQAEQQAGERALHRAHLAEQDHRAPLGTCAVVSAITLRRSAAIAPRSRPCVVA